MEQQAIRKAWEHFLVTGRISENVPEAVASSWQRSQTLGVHVRRNEAPLAPEPEILQRRRENAKLLSVARPALARSGMFLADAASMMIISDATGLIIDTAGDPRVIDEGRRNHLEVGGRWQEESIGTNAIGTALSENRAIQILGSEHFCEDVQRWACAATPLHHPSDGELLGVIDISGPASAFNPQSFALAVGIGQEIELSLDRMARQEHEELLRHFVSKRALWLNDEMLVLDSRGLIVHATPKALQLLDGAGNAPGTMREAFRGIIRGLPADAWAEQVQRHFPSARLDIIKGEDGAVGCLVATHRARGRPAPPGRAVAAPEPPVDFSAILGESPAIREARDRARKLAANALPVLIEGETGVGKELFARAMRAAGSYAAGPFVPVNCGGMARDLIASELFGYAKGSFTGADEAGRAGKIETAHGGVLCLDEIGEMPLDLQAYLLRVLEDKVVYRLGEHEGRPVDVRVLSMTNRDLTAEVEAGHFRRDLYYRIAAARLRVPPLRERGEDVLLLAERFAAGAAARLGRAAPVLADETCALLSAYHWPGNVRELRNVIETAMTLAEANRIEPQDLPEEISTAVPAPAMPSGALRNTEREAILAQVQAAGGNLTEAARRLGIARSTLYVRLARYRGG